MVMRIVGMNCCWAETRCMPMFRDRLPPTQDPRSRVTIFFHALLVHRRSPQVIFLRILSDRTIGGVLRRQARHALTDTFNPCDWKSMCVAVVEEGNNLLLQFRVERFGLGSIPLLIVAVLFAIAHGPTHISSVGLGPPAVQLRQVKTAVGEHLHSTRTTCLPRPARVVNPNVHAVHQLLGEQHVIIAEKDCMRPHFGARTNEVVPWADHCLARSICRMSLTGNEKLYRTNWISEDAYQSLRIVKQ